MYTIQTEDQRAQIRRAANLQKKAKTHKKMNAIRVQSKTTTDAAMSAAKRMVAWKHPKVTISLRHDLLSDYVDPAIEKHMTITSKPGNKEKKMKAFFNALSRGQHLPPPRMATQPQNATMGAALPLPRMQRRTTPPAMINRDIRLMGERYPLYHLETLDLEPTAADLESKEAEEEKLEASFAMEEALLTTVLSRDSDMFMRQQQQILKQANDEKRKSACSEFHSKLPPAPSNASLLPPAPATTQNRQEPKQSQQQQQQQPIGYTATQTSTSTRRKSELSTTSSFQKPPGRPYTARRQSEDDSISSEQPTNNSSRSSSRSLQSSNCSSTRSTHSILSTSSVSTCSPPRSENVGGTTLKIYNQDRVTEALSNGTAALMRCVGCGKSMLGTSDMKLIYCPGCGTLSPIELALVPSEEAKI